MAINPQVLDPLFVVIKEAVKSAGKNIKEKFLTTDMKEQFLRALNQGKEKASEWIKKQTLTPEQRQELIDLLKSGGKDIKDVVVSGWQKVCDAYNAEKFTPDCLVIDNVILDRKTIVSAVRENIVNNSDGVAAYKLIKDGKHYVYTAFCKGREFLPVKENRYLVFTAQALSADILELFGNEDFIIIK